MAQAGGNADCKYKVVAKYKTDKEVTAYQVVDSGGVKRKITKAQLCFLIGAGMITNFSLSFFNGRAVLKGIGSDSQKLPEYIDSSSTSKSLYKIYREVAVEGKTMGFEFKVPGGKTVRYRMDDVYKLAQRDMIEGVTFDKDDPTILNFKNESDLYNIHVYDLITGDEIPRVNVFFDISEVDMSPSNEDLTPIGYYDQLAYADDVTKFKSDVIVEIESFSYNELQLLDITRHSIRVGNKYNIFDIRMKIDIYSLNRMQVLNIIATIIKKFDMNSKEIKMLLRSPDYQNLCTYTYTIS